MAKKKKSAVEEEVKMDMTPMIDVTFQLLIFFIVTLKFKLLEKKLPSHLPTDFGTNTTPQEIDEKFSTIVLRQAPRADEPGVKLRARETRFYLNDKRVEGETENEIYKKVFTEIRNFQVQQPEAKGKINARLGVPHAAVVKILDIFHRAKYESIIFTGLTSNQDLITGENAKKWWEDMRADLDKN